MIPQLTFRFLVLSFVCFLLVPSQSDAQRTPDGGGPAPVQITGPCLTDEARAEIRQRLEAQVSTLRATGVLPLSPSRTSQVLFDFPMAGAPHFTDYGFYGISNFVDNDPLFPSSLLDYDCGMRTYDTQNGYNHAGIDYFLWPFEWNLVEEDAIYAVAAAPGVIIGKDDGHDHHSCSFSSDPWNAVYVMHDDGSTTWYGHLKKNSTTDKEIGETVETGEYLGVIASSGNSTGPHLHFETYDHNGNLIDPYDGDCNSFNNETWWIEQRPYFDPKVNKIQTHTEPPVWGACPLPAVLHDSDVFAPGDQIYFVTYFRDQRNINLCFFSIRRPDGSVFDSWTFTQPQPYLSASYWYWTYGIPGNAPEGTWEFRCVFAGTTYSHFFEITSDPSATEDSKKTPVHFQTTVRGSEIIITAKDGNVWDGYVSLFNAQGLNLLTQRVTGNPITTLDCTAIPSGMYFLHAEDSMGTFRELHKVILH